MNHCIQKRKVFRASWKGWAFVFGMCEVVIVATSTVEVSLSDWFCVHGFSQRLLGCKQLCKVTWECMNERNVLDVGGKKSNPEKHLQFSFPQSRLK